MPHANHDRRWLILGVLCIAVLLVVIDNTIINVALPTFSKDLHASNTSLQWIVDGYSLPFAGLLLAAGGLGDRVGRKRLILVGLFLFGAFSLFASFATNVSTLLVARALMGSSAAFIFPSTLATLTVVFTDDDERAKAFGFWGATAGLAVALGPIAGGELITHFWYGSIFLVNVPLCILAITAIALVVPESKSPERRRVDSVGLLLGTFGITALTLAIIEGPSWGWRTTSTLALFGVASALLAGFIRYELRREGPLLDVRVFRNRGFSAGAGAIATNFFCLFGFIFLVTQYFQLVRGYSALSAGVRTLPFAIVVAFCTPLSAFAALKFGAKKVVPAGLACFGGGLLWMCSIGVHDAYFGPVVGSMVVLALGFSLVNAPSTAAVMETLTPEQVGAGAAVNETTRELGGTLGVAIVGSVFASLFGPAARHLFAPFVHKGMTVAQLNLAQSSTQAAHVAASHFPVALRPELNAAINTAFMTGFHRACLVAAGVAFAVGIVAFFNLPGKKSSNS